MATTITARVLNVGTRRITLLKPSESSFFGYASINGDKVKVRKARGKGNRQWTLVS